MTIAITCEDLAFLNENLDLVTDYIRANDSRHWQLGLPVTAVKAGAWNPVFVLITYTTYTPHHSYSLGPRHCHKWRLMLEYIREHVNSAIPLFK